MPVASDKPICVKLWDVENEWITAKYIYSHTEGKVILKYKQNDIECLMKNTEKITDSWEWVSLYTENASKKSSDESKEAEKLDESNQNHTFRNPDQRSKRQIYLANTTTGLYLCVLQKNIFFINCKKYV